MAANVTSCIIKFTSKIAPFAFLKFVTDFILGTFYEILHSMVNLTSALLNALSLLICFFYLKNFKNQSIVLLDGYVAIFRTFAEFVSASVCLSYGLVEMDFYHIVEGLVSITMGLLLRTVVYFLKNEPHNKQLKIAVGGITAIYTFCVFECSHSFHQIAVRIGAVPCATRIITCVIPMLVLSESIKCRLPDFWLFVSFVEIIAMAMFWWYCSHLSLKYFVLVPSLVGFALSFIENLSSEVHRIASGDET